MKIYINFYQNEKCTVTFYDIEHLWLRAIPFMEYAIVWYIFGLDKAFFGN